MDVTFMLSQGPRGAGFIGRHFPLAKELAGLGHRVRTLAPHSAFDGLETRHLWQDGVEVYYVGQMHVRKSGGRKTYLGRFELLRVAAVTARRMARLAASLPADAYQVCKAQPVNGLAALAARRLRPRPLYVDSDDFETEYNRYSAPWQRAVVNWFERTLPRTAQGVTAQTRFNVERNVAYGVPAERVLYVPNGVDRERFAAVSRKACRRLRAELGLDGCRVIVYVGKLSVATHAVDLLLGAFARVRRQEPAARLLLVGDGQDYDGLREQAAALGLAAAVRFAGWVAPERVPVYYGLSEVSAEPVRDDVLARSRSPLKVVESIAAGVPVVTGDVGDRREIVGDAGLLVPPGDEAALAGGLLRLLRDRELHGRVTAAAVRGRERLCWDVLVHRFERVYRL
jgi:glycosyltransferase involved in cell wall biosynthesis